MAETYQNGSTAVAEAPLVKGDSCKGKEDLKAMNGPHHLEKTEPEMNGTPEENTKETPEVSEDTVERSSVEKDQNGVQDPPETVSDLEDVCKNGDSSPAAVFDDAGKAEPEVQATEEKPNSEVCSADKLEAEKLPETSAESSEVDSLKDGGSEDVKEEKPDVKNLPEQNEDLQKVNDSDESKDIVNPNDVTDEEISEKGHTEQNESQKVSVVNNVSVKDESDCKDASNEVTDDGKDKDTLDKEQINVVEETSKTNQTLTIDDSIIDISMAESEDLKEDMAEKTADESQTMSIEGTEDKPISKGEDSEEISLILSESDPSLREENDISDKIDHVTPKPTVNESSEFEDKLSKIGKLEDISDINGSKCEEMDVKCEGGKTTNSDEISKSTTTLETSTVAPVEEEKRDNKLVIKNSSSKTKSKTLDQVLSKITSIAENENQQKSVMKVEESQSQNVPKKAKARKSFAPVRESSPTINKSSITSLTFNVKELEKQGLLDIPKAQKRKAFEPMKIKSGPLADTEEPKATLGETNKLNSPGKADKSSLKKKKLNRKKKGKRGGYLLPGEKARKKIRKKGSDGEMEAGFNTKLQENVDHPKDSETVPPLRITQKQITQTAPSYSHSETVSPSRSLLYQSSLGISPTLNATSAQNSVLNVLTVTNRPLTAQMPSSNVKKAKKSMKAVDSMRKIDSFFIGGNSNQPARKPQSPESFVSIGSQGAKDTEARKRKAQGSIPSPNPIPEEKKRKVDDSAVSPQPPQLIRLVPTGSSAKFPGSTNQILLAPGTGAGPQTIIQNGTLNGLPMFQIVNGPNGATSQPQQLVAIGPGQGQSLLQSSFPRTTNLLQTSGMAPGVPVILGPVSLQAVVNNQVSTTHSQVLSSAVISSKTTLVTSHSTGFHGTRLVPVSSVLSGQQCSSETGAISLPKNPVYMNGQFLDQSKFVPKGGSIPNGLYPVTPPKTPDNSVSSSLEARESVELSPGGTALPDKDVIPLCTCKINGANFQKLASLVTYCQALDSVDGKVMGCCNKVTSTQVVRPAVKVPFLSLCESHRKRLRIHQCCPGCGHFCTQGRFLQCKKDGSNSLHLFHEQCLIVKDGKNYCPHCGETSAHVEVHLSLEENKPSSMKDSKSSRVQTKARITAKTASVTEEKTEEPSFSFTIEKTKRTISTENIPIGPDRHSLEKILACLGQERPKKFRHLPKCLYTPAFDQDLERTLYMLEDGHDPNEKYEDLEFQGALHAAATVGSLPVVHVLVQAGASPHLQDKTLRTPLMCAAENNHLDVVKYLVKAGSIVDSKADDGMTALHYAAKAGHIEVLNVLLDSERIFVDVTDDGGWTPLIWAVEHDQTDSVKLLLKRNADPNLRDSEENTTLHWAAFSGSVVIAELLLTAGCDLDSLNMHGDRPLHIAARQDHYECVVLFLARGADVEAKNDKSESPEECCPDKTTAVYLALKVNRQLKKFGAKHMGRPEKLIHRDLSKGRENIPIPCVNAFDDEGVSQDYLYVTDNIETTSLHVNRVIGSLQSCQCKDDCSSIYCACGKNSVKCWYDKSGRLIPEFNMIEPPLIFECNRACTCWTTCNNRVVQNGVMSRLQVFKTDGRGWGCKTLVDIQRGTFICEYIGEHISDSEADRREDDSYLFDLDNRDGETYCIDARKYGNIARFINHLCEPNLVPVKVFVDSQDLRFPRICLFASRDIMAGEELGFDYGEKFWIIKYKHFTCTCGSNKCRYSKETIQKTLEEYHLRHDDEEAEVINEGQAGVERVPEKAE